MAPRQMKMSEKIEAEPEEHFSQRKRPELGRYLLQVDGQIKGSYQTTESAESAGLAIKKEYPILTSPFMTALTLSARCSRRPRRSERPSNAPRCCFDF